ncbi:TauD/TfdA family dioxygenase [Streptomyces virginiae]|uniref:TauD/TfdA family dioxygenase n=1 Tax=Streptomyces virginiae TaxID=1961 RepID=UPI0036501B3A
MTLPSATAVIPTTVPCHVAPGRNLLTPTVGRPNPVRRGKPGRFTIPSQQSSERSSIRAQAAHRAYRARPRGVDMLDPSDVQSLKDVGYCVIPEVTVEDFTHTAEFLGTPRPSRPNGPLMDILTPKEVNDSRPGTISSNYGLREFPWHSDGAVDKDPPRYLLMRAEVANPQSATTDILDLHCLLDGGLFLKYSRLICETTTRRSTYLSPFVIQHNGIWRAKWDPLRMRALGKKAASFHQDVSEAAPTKRHHWTRGDLLIIDNWRCLHRRSATSTTQRAIQRIVVKNLPE